ncbi:helix-turn-helix domain-containing protein [Flavisolibacter ginsenosidimutans]|uniref:Transcriptional regulator n=1 Tax=Flavisolibacter ginsenosidimutans TaxID=661481 RepID=A0A5B8UFJ0_9BACT|nr:helix-turn-helix domain-containing protein [Flavisolibacter ginsenosidimutans]QEC55268.1 transcriptional regulator [Flavisolibacter ginsenosidimutans]
METLKYRVIKTKTQYNQYCKELENLLEKEGGKRMQDEIDLLTLLIEKWDSEHNSFDEVDPIRLLHSLMEEHNIKPKDLVHLLDVSKGYVSEILHYKKGLSKDVLRKLSKYFKVSQEAFNRPYKLKVAENSRFKNASVMNTTKKLVPS